MSDSDSDMDGGVEESPFDDYGGPDNSSQNFEDGVTRVKTSDPLPSQNVPPSLSRAPSQESHESLSKVSDVGDLPPFSSPGPFKKQMSFQFKEMAAQEDDDDDADEEEMR